MVFQYFSILRNMFQYVHPLNQQIIYTVDLRGLYSHIIMKTRLFKYIENFTTKNWKFQIKILVFFHISAQNIDCEYTLEPPRRGEVYYRNSPSWVLQ